MFLIVAVILAACGNGSGTVQTTPTAATSLSTFAPGPTTGSATPQTVLSSNTKSTCMSDPNTFMNADEYRASVRCAVPLFQWPPGRTPDPTKMTANIDPTGRYQGGYEYSGVIVTNMCIWYMTFLDAHKNGNAQLEQQTLDYMLNVIPNYDSVIPNFPPGFTDPASSERERQEAQQAQLGDPSSVQSYVDGTCIPVTPALWGGS